MNGFLRGFAAGAGLVLLIVGLAAAYVVKTRYEPLYGKIEPLLPLLEEAARLLDTLNQSGLPAAYTTLANKLPEIKEALATYKEIYGLLSGHVEELERLYNETHSRWYNDTLRELERVSTEASPVLRLLGIDSLASDAAKAMKLGQEATSLTAKTLSILQSLPPSRLEKLLETFSKLAETMPPERLNQTLSQAAQLLREAQSAAKAVKRYPPSRLLRYAEATAASGAALLVAGVAAEAAARRRGAAEG